jgi:serine/threonine-protein kinase
MVPMRLRFDRFQHAHGRLRWTSIALLVAGALGVVFGSFAALMGLLMFVMTGGGLWERRAGVTVGVFFGLFPLLGSALMAWRGAARRAELRRLRNLAALARQMPEFGADDVARALDVGPAEAHRAVIDALTAGILEDAPMAHAPVPPRATVAPSIVAAPTAPGAPAQGSQDTWLGASLHGTYRIEARLASGGMGLVYRAVHLRTGRRYAVKTLLPDARLSPDALRRFEREATAASALGHPNIIGVHDFNVRSDGAYYLVMDLLEGETLEQRLHRVGSLAWPEAQRIATELGSALATAHDHGLLHRDLKPANVFLAKGGDTDRAVLLDFGLVKPIDDTSISRITQTGAAVGTPMYMSPEQARGDTIDARSDVYGLAAVLFEMVTGAPPFLDRTLATVYARLLTSPAPTASAVAHKPIPAELDTILAKGLAKDPRERYADVRALVADVTKVEGRAA